MGAGQAEILPQELHQKRARIDVAGDGFTVHRHCDGCHGSPPRIEPNGSRRRWIVLADGNRRQIGAGIDFAPHAARKQGQAFAARQGDGQGYWRRID
jgi:hypothetical protein